MVLAPRGHRTGHSARQHNAGGIGDITGFVIDDLVTGIEQRPQGDIDGFRNADGNQHFAQGLVAHAKMALHVVRNGTPQPRQTEIGTVAGAALFQRVDGGFTDVPRRGEVRLPDAKGDHVPHGLDDFKKVPDA